jgi:hypothetical protein
MVWLFDHNLPFYNSSVIDFYCEAAGQIPRRLRRYDLVVSVVDTPPQAAGSSLNLG